ncbi:MAG: sterol desaturase family protein [Rhodospirillaceae bacterium]|jgi:sterol desaturase/sphingolipid hydroxylase (fatty acid hydroxylase superfamily)|nr:sterol desaturase family protein [Rhodospirillaceae bacterium]
MDQATDTLLLYKSIAVGGWFALLFVLERVWPAAPRVGLEERSDGRIGDRRRLGRNAGLWLVNLGLGPLFVIPVSAWAAGWGPGLRPDWWAGWPGLIADLILLDFLIYWWHRANHTIPFLWRFHEIHHLDRFLDTTSAVRFHAGEVALSALFRAGVIVLFGIPIASVLAFEVAVLAAALFHHSNLRLPPGLERGLSRVVITPSIHWIHHHATRVDTDSNYGTILSVWDPLFGSRNRRARELDMVIGVEGEAERGFLDLLARPFQARPPAA